MIDRLKRIHKWINSTTQRRLIFWSLAFWVVSIFTLLMTFLWIGQSQMLTEARQRNIQMASSISRDLNAQIGGISENARTFSQHLEMLNPDLDSQAAAILGLRLSSPRYKAVYYFDRSGLLLLYLTDPAVSLLSMKNADEIVARPPIALKDEVLAARNSVQGTGTLVSDVYNTPLDYAPVFYIGTSVRFSTGESRVIIYEIDLSDIWQKIDLSSVGKTGVTYAVSREGIVISHPNSIYVGEPMPAAVSPVLQSNEGYAEYLDPLSKKNVVAAYSPVGGLTGWGIVVQQDQTEIYATTVKTGGLITAVWLLLSIIGTASIFLLIRSFTRPIKNLTLTVHTIADTGNLTKTGMAGRSDEVGQLSQVFDRMVDRLQTTEGRVAQAAAEERNRLARDLHDAVSQTLFSASLIAEVLPRLWERNPAEGRKRLEEVRQLTRGALAEMRTLLLELRPSALVEAEMPYLLRQLGESISGRSRIPVNISVEGECNLLPEVKIGLYRIAQEALNNVAKHSEAKEARVSLVCGPEQVNLSIRDDGRGFNAAENAGKSLGMGIIRERAKEIGASLTIESRIGKGTEIAVTWIKPRQV